MARAVGAVGIAHTGFAARKPFFVRLRDFARRKPLGAAGGVIVVGLVLVATLAPLLAPFNPYKQYLEDVFRPPGAPYFLGTDDLGRDILSRIIWGARVSLYVGLLAVISGTTVGGVAGLVSGYVGGKMDMLLQRLMDALMSFPTLILALSIMAALGTSLSNVVIAIAIVEIPRASRVMRSTSLSVKEMQYVEASRAVGSSGWRIVFRHVLPNCLAPYIVLATAELGAAIIVEASLSFLGLGTPPPEPSWGGMLARSGRSYLERAPWIAIFPGLVMSMVVFGFNLLGDAVRDIWDPRLRGA